MTLRYLLSILILVTSCSEELEPRQSRRAGVERGEERKPDVDRFSEEAEGEEGDPDRDDYVPGDDDGIDTNDKEEPGQIDPDDPAAPVKPTFTLEDVAGDGVHISITNEQDRLVHRICRGLSVDDVNDKASCEDNTISDWVTSGDFKDEDPLYLRDAYYNVLVKNSADSVALGSAAPMLAKGSIRLSMGMVSSCLLDAKGELYCWGRNYNGEAGLGHASNVPALTRVGTDTWKAMALTSGGEKTAVFAIKSNGELYRWGRSNVWRQLYYSPTRIGTKSDWVDVQYSMGHACAVDREDEVYCFGNNYYGAITSDTTPTMIEEPTLLPGVKWSELTVGSFKNWRISPEGKLSTWGGVMSGIREYTRQDSPVEIGKATDWTFITSSYDAACGVRSEELYCWGKNTFVKLGVANTSGYVPSPERVLFDQPVSTVSVYFSTFCLITTDRDGFCWGTSGTALGNGSTTAQTAPTRIHGDHKWLILQGANYRTCGIVESGDLYCFGKLPNGDFESKPKKMDINVFEN